MFCKDFAENIALYADDALNENERAALGGHLDRCPLCRAKFAEIQALRNDLKTFARPAAPADLLSAVRGTVAAELKQTKAASVSGENLREWLWMRVMPYGVGITASLLLTFAFLSSLVSSRNAAQDARERTAQSRQPALILKEADNPYGANDVLLTQADFAALRLPVSNESPSINPSGALIALTKSLARGEMTDEEVVIVADVFGDGIARIAEVVEAPRSRQSLKDLENALQNDPAYAPFVPASLDQRPQNMRVVLKIQRVEVATGLKNNPITQN